MNFLFLHSVHHLQTLTFRVLLNHSKKRFQFQFQKISLLLLFCARMLRDFKSKFYWVSVHLVDIVLNFNQEKMWKYFQSREYFPVTSHSDHNRAGNEPSQNFKFCNYGEGPYNHTPFLLFRNCEIFVKVRFPALVTQHSDHTL